MANISRPAKTQCVSVFVIRQNQLINPITMMIQDGRKEVREEVREEGRNLGRKGGDIFTVPLGKRKE